MELKMKSLPRKGKSPISQGEHTAAAGVGTPRLDHIPQTLPTSLRLAPSPGATRRWRSCNTSLLCPSPILRTGRARTPLLFGLGPGPSRDEGFKGSRTRLCLPELLDHRLNRSTEKIGRRNRCIGEKALLFLPDVRQVYVWIASPRPCQPPFGSRHLLEPPAGGGAATLAFCARLQSSDRDGPGHLCCSGWDLDLRGMKVLKAAERDFASLNFSTTVLTEWPSDETQSVVLGSERWGAVMCTLEAFDWPARKGAVSHVNTDLMGMWQLSEELLSIPAHSLCWSL
ncbi:hypothetical protein G5714_023684 [Onychostoma macrolepis]|uniref:Uncharacterized protein n=1 Tax=Onychostoma macrolepis TaxID=369639 RepID=A0A7J6BN15_9TELE|nr:hypothetical protein G5714_023684 [Onychostoma macrolepis]